ncbi:UDP-N-acetylmuramoyl-tripeptide--D-alanyl-D-alanine ligase [Candidatus Parcubacteria bacterium]|nr:UDP-N-acetylmuramoyl-tripeptide--D-alanyl-D-alanine ligase [Patescibacteria group bacterium]MCG2688834.1 UDP-N-acetylmuramoyl-tripeptide--D-alanyl-D-alanine ligase [Candidatus Parcubacteria bacterium]
MFTDFIHILQLEEYQLIRFIKWSLHNPFGKKLENKKSLVWTEKARFVAVVAIVWYLIIGAGLLEMLGILGAFTSAILLFFPWVFISLAVITRKPYEVINRKITIYKTRKKILSLKSRGLKIIGITGSYGKTTTKEFLYRILKTHFRVLRTPESYNTLFGIAKVVDLELDENYDFFICEMGAYKIGEIKELCYMIPPDFAILTGINEQHLERFKKIENTIKAKFELIEAVKNKAQCLLNRDCRIILDNYQIYTSDPMFYSLGDFKIKNPFLIGKANLTNATGAGKMALLLGVSLNNVRIVLNTLKPIPHRLEIKKLDNDWIILDDSYNSNVDGFKQALEALANFKNHTRIIVTPGIVELGNKTLEIHQTLGKLVNNICDYAVLVGKNERTEMLASTIKNKGKVIFIKSIKDLNETVANLEIKPPVILIENDLTDNY